MKRFTQIAVLVLLGAFVVSCSSGSDQDDTEAAVYLTANIDSYGPDVDICGELVTDLLIESMTIDSHAKIPEGQLSSAQDVNLTTWVVTPVRTDGGTVASPVWQHEVLVYVPAGGTASLQGARVYGQEFLDDLPLSNLFPENGGVDTETGYANIRQTLNVAVYGRTISGKAISVEFPVAFNFTCGS